jgi:hypothetical protein
MLGEASLRPIQIDEREQPKKDKQAAAANERAFAGDWSARPRGGGIFSLNVGREGIGAVGVRALHGEAPIYRSASALTVKPLQCAD